MQFIINCRRRYILFHLHIFVLSFYILLGIDGVCVGHQGAALLATLFDVGGIAGMQNFSMSNLQYSIHVSKRIFIFISNYCFCVHVCVNILV